MFNFLKHLFTKKDLIPNLIDEHKLLLQSYKQIETYINNNNFEDAKKELQNFLDIYHKHILVEDSVLYVALEKKYKDNPDIFNTIKTINNDMNVITNTINNFAEKYQQIDIKNKKLFIIEWENIENILLQRIELEEERLYTLL